MLPKALKPGFLQNLGACLNFSADAKLSEKMFLKIQHFFADEVSTNAN